MGHAGCLAGRLTLAVFLGLVVAGALMFLPGRAIVPYIFYLVVLTLLLVAVRRLKGEKSGWRWGDD